MRRYYHTDNASRAVRAGGFEFVFEPTVLRAGAWSGLLSTEDESAQAVLATLVSDDGPIREITEEEFNLQKKKTTNGVHGSLLWREPSAPLLKPRSAAPAAEQPPPARASSAGTDVSVAFTDAEPPDELSEEPQKKPARKRKP